MNDKGKNDRAGLSFAPKKKAITNKQSVLSKESIKTDIALEVINNCLGKYIFLNKFSLAINDCEHCAIVFENIVHGMTAENKKMA
nr:hypothetical protein [Cronobacter turicensis]